MMFEPDAESMPAEQRAGLQEQRLRALVDRLLALGRGSGGTAPVRPASPLAAISACVTCPGSR